MASKKQFIVIAIYHIKRNGATIYRVRSSQPNKNGHVEGTDQEERNGLWYDAHNVTVCDGRVSGCTCKGSQFKGKCYHRDGVQTLVVARKAAKAAKVAQSEEKPSAQEVVSLDDKRRERDMLDAPLTRNSGFSLLKVS